MTHSNRKSSLENPRQDKSPEWPKEWWDKVSDRSWLDARNRRVMIGGHFTDVDQTDADILKHIELLNRYDPVDIVRKLKAIGTEVFYFYSKCHCGNAYYPTKHGHIHSQMHGRDFFGEMVRACLEEDILPGCVYEFSDNRIRKDNPDWCHRQPKAVTGKNVEITEEAAAMEIAGACLNGPYGDMVIEQTKEVVSQYPIACYWIDFLGLFGNFDAWECPHCNALYRKEFGSDFPGTAGMSRDEYLRYYNWRYRVTDEYAGRLMAEVRAIRPELPVCLNYFALNPGKTAQLTMDITRRHFDFVGKDVFTNRVGSLRGSWMPRAVRSASAHAPGEMLLDSLIACQGDLFSPKPLGDYRGEIWTTRLAGAKHCASVIPTCEGELSSAQLALIKQVFDEQNKFESVLAGAKVASRLGILLDVPTLQLDSLENAAWTNSEEVSYHYTELAGWVQSLIENHELWDLLQDPQLTADDLKCFDVLVLPHATCLSSAQVEAVREFVNNGGTLVASGSTSLKSRDGQVLGNFALADVFGVDLQGGLEEDLRWVEECEPLLSPRPAHYLELMPSDSGHVRVKVHGAARVLAHAHRQFVIPMTLATKATETASLVEHPFGKGRCFYFPWLPGHQYWKTGHHTLARFLHSVLDHSHPRPRAVEFEGPGTVELFLLRLASDSPEWLIGLVNRPGGLSRHETVHPISKATHPLPRKFDLLEDIPALAAAGLVLRPSSPEQTPVVEVLHGATQGESELVDGATRVELRNLAACCLIKVTGCVLD